MPHVEKQMISFFLTTKCNLCCIYCYNAEERDRLPEMSLPPLKWQKPELTGILPITPVGIYVFMVQVNQLMNLS